MGPEGLLEELREVLWPEDDPDRAWSPDTIQNVAALLADAGYGRRYHMSELRPKTAQLNVAITVFFDSDGKHVSDVRLDGGFTPPVVETWDEQLIDGTAIGVMPVTAEERELVSDVAERLSDYLATARLVR